MSRSRLSVLVLLAACAQASPPPGGPPDREPPRILETTPAQGAVVPDFKDAVVFKFDQTLSERGARPADVIVVSPEAGEVKVDRSGSELKVTVAGGWQKGRIYHVNLLPGLQDRFGNPRVAAYDLIFSTGPAIPTTALGGLVSDRLTSRPVANARVLAVSAIDSAAYATQTDTAGFFAFRSLPMGAYRVTAFTDLNRNRKLDGADPRDSTFANVATVRDTQVVEFSVLAPDSTPARLLRADARDSLQVRLAFDDFMEGNEPLAGVTARAWQFPDSTPVSGVVLHLRDFEARQRAARDTLVPPPVRRAARADTSRILPSQELVWVPNRPLTPRARHRITVTGIRNITGLANGGGSVTFEAPARPRALPTDTTGALRAKPDTAAVIRDTTRARRP